MQQSNRKEFKFSTFEVAGRKVGGKEPCFIIAEIGNNHNGSVELAKKLVDLAVEAGVDAVKFQLRDMDSLYGSTQSSEKVAADLSTQYTLDLLKKFQLTREELRDVFNYCRQKNILAFCTPWDEKSVDFLEECDVPLYKIASADFSNHILLKKIASTKKPMLCSCGMSNQEEIVLGLDLLESLSIPYAILHCNSTYPAPFKDVNLEYLTYLNSVAPVVGYSGHERGIYVAMAAVAKGAKVIEKHFTIDKSMEGVDHRVSLLPQEMAEMVKGIRQVEEALGSGGPMRISQGQMMNRENLGKSIVMKCNLKKGEKIEENMLDIRSPGQGLAPYRMKAVIGQLATRDLKTGDVLFETDLPQRTRVEPRNYKFRRPWGIPVRYHDALRLANRVQPDLLEFHLSYSDMDENLSKFFNQTYDIDYVVHAPELFAGDHLLDLCSKDAAYKQQSIDNMKRVIEITVGLKKYFPKTKRPMIVINAGGFTANAPLSREEAKPLYFEILNSLQKLDSSEVEIIPQTMAPFPWHFGGQQYQNLFKFPDEIDWFCREFKYRMCLDYSHSHLTCNYHNYTMDQFLDFVAPHTAHLHLGDAVGVDGEGLQVGEGEIDFKRLAAGLDKHCPKAWFIPEIWQGHKNEGEGFWIALEKLEQWL